MLEMPLEAILKDLPLSEDLKAGYLEKDSIYFHYLKLLKALEYADVIEITAVCRELTIMEDTLADASVRSVAWANQMTSFMI
jgi:EAL and modified HD-GYP domain-containing signal transduction protein